MIEKIKILLADDHRLFREGLRRLLEFEDDMEVVGEAKDGLEAVNLAVETSPDIILLDINMPVLNGGQVVKKLRDENCNPKYLVITAYDDEENVLTLSSSGISGYILKSSGMNDLLSAVRLVCNGGSYIDPKVAGKFFSSFQKHRDKENILLQLTQRERDVFSLLSQGYSNQEISDRLILSEKTVKNHVSHLLKKLGLNDRTQAAVLAWKMGLVKSGHESEPFMPDAAD